jgi:hypothetical protein
VDNPFRPTAGAQPPDLVGRAGLLDEFEYGLRLRSGALGLLAIFTGARGIGKTVMLSAAEDLARMHGWVVISETATPGFMRRIGNALQRLLDELGPGPSGRRITALSAAGFGVTTQLPAERQEEWRHLGARLLRALDEKQTGLLLTVDEIHAANRAELAQLAADVQHFIREGLPIALLFAGLPAAVSDLLNEGVATFLRRADRIDLHAASVEETARSYEALFGEGGFSLDPETAHAAAEATGGYPFLIQLVGYFLWREAETAGGPITGAMVERATEAARRRNDRMVIEAALANVSELDFEFLRAMSQDDGPSATGEIGRRLGLKSNAVANYRTRLIDAGLVEPAGFGKVDFAIPGLREYLRNRSS